MEVARTDVRWVRTWQTWRSGADLYKGVVVKKPQTWSLQGKASGEETAGPSLWTDLSFSSPGSLPRRSHLVS